jgi:hypothetical protein
MADAQLIKLVGERRKRLVASIMGHAEREFFAQLSPTQQREFRTKTLTAIDEFADLMRDVIKITGEDSVVNAHAIDLLQQIHDGQRALAKRLS